MSKLAVVSILIGSAYSNISKITHPTLQRYAKDIGADFIIYDGTSYKIHTKNKTIKTLKSKNLAISYQNFPFSKSSFGSYSKMNLVELLEIYDRILYLDTDIIVRENCPNLFEIVPKEKVGMFNEGDFLERKSFISSWESAFVTELEYKNNDYYNSGVILFSRGQEGIFDVQEKLYDDGCYEQTTINANILKNKTNMFNLGHRFNRMHFMDSIIEESRYESHILHYAGSSFFLKNNWEERLKKIIIEDLSIWERYHENKKQIKKFWW